MNVCPNAKKITITYTNKQGVASELVMNEGGLDIECIDTTRTGKYIFTVNDGGYNPNCSPQGAITLYTNKFTADSYSVSVGEPPNPLVAACTFVKLTFFIEGDQLASQSFPTAHIVSQVKNPDYTPGGRTLRVKNRDGLLLFQRQVKDCNYKVACDDGCPQGYCKCKINKYPGYCCINTQEIAADINAIANGKGRCCE